MEMLKLQAEQLQKFQDEQRERERQFQKAQKEAERAWQESQAAKTLAWQEEQNRINRRTQTVLTFIATGVAAFVAIVVGFGKFLPF